MYIQYTLTYLLYKITLFTPLTLQYSIYSTLFTFLAILVAYNFIPYFFAYSTGFFH